MIVDPLTVDVLAAELEARLVGTHLRAAALDTAGLQLRFGGDGRDLALHLLFGPPADLRVLDDGTTARPGEPGSERYLVGSRVEGLCQEPGERVLELRLSRPDAAGLPSYGRLQLSLIPPRFRACLYGEGHGRVLGAWAAVGDPRGGRPGDPAPQPPARPARLTPGPEAAPALAALCAAAGESDTIEQVLRGALEGLDRHLAQRVCADAGVAPAAPARQAGEAAAATLCAAALNLRPEPGAPVYRWRRGSGPARVSVVPPADGSGERFDSLLAALAAAPAAATGAESDSAAVTTQSRRLRRGRQRLARREAALAGDLEEAGTEAQLGRLGDALMAAAGSLAPGQPARVLDVHDPAGTAHFEVELEPGETAAKRGAQLLKQAGKLRRRLEVLPARLHRVRELLWDTDRLLARLEGAHEPLLEAEMERWESKTGAAGRPQRQAPRDRDGGGRGAGARPRRYRTSDGWSVWAGRSNQENDVVTHKLAAQNDLWFHAHGYAGSHVILRREDRKEEPSKTSLQEAAAVAAYWSKGRTASKVPVVYTLAKHVSKPRGGPPGLAVMKREKTIMVRPALLDEEDAPVSLSTGILGLPNVGKSTLFNALTRSAAAASNYPFCTIDPNVAIVEVPDPRLQRLEGLLQPASCTPTAIRFTDIAGLVRGASRGEGRGNQFLADVRGADALLHVVRCFEDDSVSHVDTSVDPVRDADTIDTELVLADLEITERNLPTLDKVVRSDPRSPRKLELTALEAAHAALGRGAWVADAGLTAEQQAALRGYDFLTAKPVMLVANVGEADAGGGGAHAEALRAGYPQRSLTVVSAQIEAEIAQLDAEERAAFLEDLGLEQSGVDRLVHAAYGLLDLITFYTLANDKLQAWQLPRGTRAPAAAGRIHSDMEEGFVRAEVAHAVDLEAAEGQWTRLREAGKLRAEGRDYEVQDGDVVTFLFKN